MAVSMRTPCNLANLKRGYESARVVRLWSRYPENVGDFLHPINPPKPMSPCLTWVFSGQHYRSALMRNQRHLPN